MPNLIVFGDSVTWGQGLADHHKMSSLVASSLAGLQVVMLAHSGGVIGHTGQPCGGPAAPGEIPESCPNIIEQINAYTGDTNDVPLVIVDGGINDIGVETILNPFTSSADLQIETDNYCHKRMGELLALLVARFPNPATRFAVTSYFPILSNASHPFSIPILMEFFGIKLPSFVPTAPIIGKVIANCQQFWQQSNLALQAAVDETNVAAGSKRVRFANPGFTDQNSVFAPNAWLFGLMFDFEPEDEVIALRHAQCDVAFAGDILAREKCYRASAGHPNPTGAQQFANAILNALN